MSEESKNASADRGSSGVIAAPTGAIRRGFRGISTWATPWIVLVVGILTSLLLFTVVRDAVENVARLRFERQASDANSAIENRLHFYADVLYGLRALFSSQGPVSRGQFHAFIQSLDLKRRYPGIDSLNYAAYVSAADKKRFEETVRSDATFEPQGYPRFAIKPAGERPEYFVLVYLEPMAGYEYAFGLDLGANPNAANPMPLVSALHAGRDSGELIASGQPLRIKIGGKESTYLAMRLAVYINGMSLDTVERRRTAYLGSVGAGFNIESLMKGVLDEKMLQYMRFTVHDAGAAGALSGASQASRKLLVFDSNQLAQKSSDPYVADGPSVMFSRVLPLEIAGRIWEFQFSARKDAVVDHVDRVLPWMVLGGGLLSSVLLFGMFYSLASSRGRAIEIAKEITSDLRDSTEHLQAVSRRLVDVQESERRQVSRELHDRVGQNLTALSISLDILKSQLAGNGKDAMRSRLDDASSLLEATSNVIENVMSDLRPPMLDDYGLLPALQWYANEFSGRTGIQVRVVGDERMKRLPQASEIGLFRIAQEALNNVAKHAHAGHADVVLKHSDGQFMMVVSDDGTGFDPVTPAVKRRQGLGMMTMRERTQAVGGRFEVTAVSGGGTQVVVRIPT